MKIELIGIIKRTISMEKTDVEGVVGEIDLLNENFLFAMPMPKSFFQPAGKIPAIKITLETIE